MTLSTSYWRNVWRWAAGFGRLGTLRYKPGWSARSPAWIAVYLIDYGAAVLVLGIGCQPISRWAGERDHQPWRALARLLNRLDDGHTDEAGGLLWQTAPCRDRTRYVVMTCWALALVAWVVA